MAYEEMEYGRYKLAIDYIIKLNNGERRCSMRMIDREFESQST